MIDNDKKKLFIKRLGLTISSEIPLPELPHINVDG